MSVQCLLDALMFYGEDNNRAKFCEFNSDDSSGMGNNRNTNNACYEMIRIQEFRQYPLEDCVDPVY